MCFCSSGFTNYGLALRVEWLKSRERAARWTEEVLLLQEEMRRVVAFLEWKAMVADKRIYKEGTRAYANKQAALYRRLQTHFRAQWHGQLENSSFAKDDTDGNADDEAEEDGDDMEEDEDEDE